MRRAVVPKKREHEPATVERRNPQQWYGDRSVAAGQRRKEQNAGGNRGRGEAQRLTVCELSDVGFIPERQHEKQRDRSKGSPSQRSIPWGDQWAE